MSPIVFFGDVKLSKIPLEIKKFKNQNDIFHIIVC